MKNIAITQQPDRRKRSDRRTHTRMLSNIEFSFSFNGQQFNGHIDNISLSGAFLSELQPTLTAEHISQTGQIEIHFNGELLSLACEVVYVIPMDDEYFPIGAGVVFNDTDPVTLSAINTIATVLELRPEDHYGSGDGLANAANASIHQCVPAGAT